MIPDHRSQEEGRERKALIHCLFHHPSPSVLPEHLLPFSRFVLLLCFLSSARLFPHFSFVESLQHHTTQPQPPHPQEQRQEQEQEEERARMSSSLFPKQLLPGLGNGSPNSIAMTTHKGQTYIVSHTTRRVLRERGGPRNEREQAETDTQRW